MQCNRYNCNCNSAGCTCRVAAAAAQAFTAIAIILKAIATIMNAIATIVIATAPGINAIEKPKKIIFSRKLLNRLEIKQEILHFIAVPVFKN